ncbi:MAG: hypothetical protein FJ014_15140 [Chloroflexi bacterium]|nr:hypothetical protein [Chloroflexota bacterium]
MWTIAEYHPTSLFSLRPYTATTSGGKSLIVPTPFALKMALLDVAIRTQGLKRGQAFFPAIRTLQVAVRLPQRIIVNNTFTKILRLKETKTKASEKEAAIAQAKADHQWPFQKTIAFREYVQFGGALALALQGMPSGDLMPLLMQVNYLGKRGGFIQLLPPLVTAASLPDGFTITTEGVNGAFPLGMLQMVDDCGPELTFDRANVFSDQAIRVGRDRIFHHIVLPYRLVRSSKSFSYYERI